MKPEEIHLTDWMRIFVGEVPASFYIEAVIRIVFIYLLLLASMRLMGNRMGSMLTRNEMIALVSLAAANGVALMAPDRGLLPVVVIAAVIIGYQHLIGWWAMRNKKFESAVLDDVAILVEDGRIQLNRLEQSVLPQERLFSRLRTEGIDNLGAVQRVYQEANGAFSILTFEEPQPGLSILPVQDTVLREEQQKANGCYACARCANVVESPRKPSTSCERCGEQQWETAVIGLP
jgi:uncharacterized membrane protein YcaP (DUF421 family)